MKLLITINERCGLMDFKKLREKNERKRIDDPIEIFRRSPKPRGINDLYSSQHEILKSWYQNRDSRDTVLKLHTGGGKTLVGLLMAQSTLNEKSGSVLYLAPTRQLVEQTIDKATDIGISAVKYETGKPLHEDFINGKSIMVSTYQALFNGKSKFGIKGGTNNFQVSAIILDDAHVAFSVVRDAFTLEILSKTERELYNEFASIFRQSFKEIDKLGTFDDVLSGSEFAVLEIPYWEWLNHIDTVREKLRHKSDDFAWPLLRDHLKVCHAFISKDSFSISPIQPMVDLFPTFEEAPRRIYMSATISDDSDIVSTFNAKIQSENTRLKSRSLAGISERMILMPDLMPFKTTDVITKILEWTTQRFSSVILVPSSKKAEKWAEVATIASKPTDIEEFVRLLKSRESNGPFVFANRYDGIDLPNNACRLLIMDGLPMGTSNYDLYKSSVLFNGRMTTKLMAQRIEQGIGRGARGAGDYCVVMLTGSDLSSWVSQSSNFEFLTSATKAQLEIGRIVSKEVKTLTKCSEVMIQSYFRDSGWVQYHAETLAELVDEEETDILPLKYAEVERKALELWQNGYLDKAINKIERFLNVESSLDLQAKGWLEQLAARIAYDWGDNDLSQNWQQKAYADNRYLIRSKVLPPYRPIIILEDQSIVIIEKLKRYRDRRGFMHSYEEVVSKLHNNASANQFEEALLEFAKMIGLHGERCDSNGEGPDVLWLLPNKTGLIIEAKSRRKQKNAFGKVEHGQLLVAKEWFKKNYPDYKGYCVSVHPTNKSTKAAVADGTLALTFENLNRLISDTRVFLKDICKSQLADENLLKECEILLSKSNIKYTKIIDNYLIPFKGE